VKLSKSTIDGLVYTGDPKSKKICIYWDDSLAGFGVRVYPSGRKVFFCRKRTKTGEQRFMTIGDVGVFNLKTARERAVELLTKIARGEDPLPYQSRGDQTVKSFSQTYLARHALSHKKSWKEDKKRLDAYVIPWFGGRRLTELRRELVAQKISALGVRAPYQANRVLSLIGKMHECAIDWGLIPESSPNPARRIRKFREIKRERYVYEDEMPRLAEALNTYPNPYISTLLWLYLLTGLRKTELLSLRWSSVDLRAKRIYLKTTKTKDGVDEPLSDLSVKLLRSIPKKLGNPYVFPSRTGRRKHINSLSKDWKKILLEANIKNLRIHDLRRTFGSYLVSSGERMEVISKLLHHSDVKVTAEVYAHLSERPLRDALEKQSLILGDFIKLDFGLQKKS
jgi:integrase